MMTFGKPVNSYRDLYELNWPLCMSVYLLDLMRQMILVLCSGQSRLSSLDRAAWTLALRPADASFLKMDSVEPEYVCSRCCARPDPNAYIESVGAALIDEALKEKCKIESEIAAVKVQLSLARRRIAGHDASRADSSKGNELEASDPGRPWIHSGRDVTEMKARLEAAETDEDELMKLVGDVRREKESRTEMALKYYAARTNKLLSR